MADKKGELNPIGLPAHIRVKRHKLALFIHTDLRIDTVLVIKERLEKLTGVPVMKQRLYFGKQLIQNPATLWDSGIEVEDAELTLAFCLGFGPGDVEIWEDRVEAIEGPPQTGPSSTTPGPGQSAPSGQDVIANAGTAGGQAAAAAPVTPAAAP